MADTIRRHYWRAYCNLPSPHTTDQSVVRYGTIHRLYSRGRDLVVALVAVQGNDASADHLAAGAFE